MSCPALAQGRERWEHWWAANQDPFLRLKAKLHRAEVTTTGDYNLGEGAPGNVSSLILPSRGLVEEKIVPALRLALQDDSTVVRAEAVLAMGKTTHAPAISWLKRLLKDESEKVRENTALALGILGHGDGVELLTSILNDDRRGRQLVGKTELAMRTRAFAAISLGLIGRENPEIREKVVTILSESLDLDLSPKDVPLCIVVALGLMEDPAAGPLLLSILKDTRGPQLVRAHALVGLGKLNRRSLLPTVQIAMRDDSTHVLRSSIISLGLLSKSSDTKSVALLANWAAKGKEPQGRGWALIALGEIGGVKAERVLMHTLQNDQDWRKAYAALGLSILGRESDNRAIPEAIHRMFLTLKADSVKASMAISLGLLKYRTASQDLANVVSSKSDPRLRGHCAVALGLMNARDTSQVIKRVLDLRLDPKLRSSAAQALGLMGDPEVVRLLTDILRGSNTEAEISSAARSLGLIGDPTAVDALVAILKDVSGSPDAARASAALALGDIAEQREVPPLQAVSAHANYRALVGSFRALLLTP